MKKLMKLRLPGGANEKGGLEGFPSMKHGMSCLAHILVQAPEDMVAQIVFQKNSLPPMVEHDLLCPPDFPAFFGF